MTIGRKSKAVARRKKEESFEVQIPHLGLRLAMTYGTHQIH
jgi:hypothetical protein